MNRMTLTSLVLVCSACLDPQDRFDDFITAKRKLISDAGTDPSDEPGNTEPLKAEQVPGTYLYAISTPQDPTHPTVYLAEVEATQVGDGLEVRIRQRPLAVADRKTPVGEYSDWIVNMVDASGAYQSPTITTVVPPSANAFGLALTTMVTFKGTFKNPATAEMPDAKVAFFCGTATGIVEGLNLSLEGSTFAALRVPDPMDTSTYPNVVINCNNDPAAPL